jgi:hypothetical protein
MSPLNLSPEQTERFKEMVAELRKSTIPQDIDRMIEILLGDFLALPSFWESIEKRGISHDQFWEMTSEEQVKLMLKDFEELEQTRLDLLDTVCQERYGWPKGTVGKLTLWQLFLALEHATEYDSPSKPSVWRITK